MSSNGQPSDVKLPTKIDSSLPQVGPSQKQKPLKKRIVNSPNFLDGLITSQSTMLQPQKSNVQVPINISVFIYRKLCSRNN